MTKAEFFKPLAQSRLAAAALTIQQQMPMDGEYISHIIDMGDRLNIRPVPRDENGEPILQLDMTDAEFVELFIAQWNDIQSLILEGKQNYERDYDADLQLRAENMGPLAREAVRRFPPATAYSRLGFVEHLFEFARNTFMKANTC